MANEKRANSVTTRVPVIVDNDATAAAMYEARRRLRNGTARGQNDFVLVRAGTGIGVGLVSGGEVYRGTGTDRGLLGEFGHMTVVVGGKLCKCGNRGCWELYASATSAASLYAGEWMSARGSRPPRFVEIVARAEAGELRAQATLGRVGKYLGIGIGNVIIGLGVSQVVVSGRIVHGWKFIQKSLREAVAGTMAGRLSNWSVEQGQPTGAGLGGALEVAIEHYLSEVAGSTRAAA
jgi:predicted NBD/HSP70 family sugar kinase